MLYQIFENKIDGIKEINSMTTFCKLNPVSSEGFHSTGYNLKSSNIVLTNSKNQ